MPTYFFHFTSPESQDTTGLDFPDLTQAHSAAIEGARSLLADCVRRGSLPLSSRIQIADATGEVIRTLSFGDAVLVE